MARDAADHLERLSAEAEQLRREEAAHAGKLDNARATVETLAATTIDAEDALDQLNEQAASAAARRAVRYYIEDIDIFGKVTRHGPILVEPGTRSTPRVRATSR